LYRLRSDPQIPQYRTLSLTSPGGGSGMGASRTVMVREDSKNAARIRPFPAIQCRILYSPPHGQ